MATVPNLRWSYADSHNHLEPGGWGRQTTIRELPVAKTIAGVNMRLTPGGVREALAFDRRMGLHDRRPRSNHYC